MSQLMMDQFKAMVEQLGGEAKAMKVCNDIYSSTFLGDDPLTLSEVSEHWEGEAKQLKLQAAIHFYCLSHGVTYPTFDGDYEDDCLFDSYVWDVEEIDYKAAQWFDENYPDFEITGDTVVVHTCNYKGEGDEDGLKLYETVKHLPVY